MTVSSLVNKVIFTGDGATLVFAYTFVIFEDANLEVKIVDTVTGVETLLVLTTDYTVSGAGNPPSGVQEVTLLLTGQLSSAPSATDEIVIARIMPLTQLIDYVENDPFPAETHEEGLDRGIMIDQQLQEQLDRALLIPSNITGVDTSLPAPEAGAAIGWNNTADGLTNNPSGIAKVGVDVDAVPDFLGASGSTGVLRTGANLSYVDGVDFIFNRNVIDNLIHLHNSLF